MSDQQKSLEAAVDSILEASGDLVLSVGSQRGRLVPNAGVDVSELNSRIQEYQKQLDTIELELRRNMEK